MRLTLGLAGVLVALSSAAFARYDASAGRPASKPLPTYCQMGRCFVTTVEAVDPVLFGPSAVIFQVESQNWEGDFNPKSLRRGHDSAGYVLCSKRRPATIDRTDDGRYMVSFLTPNEESTYNHANETAMALYFTVCHGRAFGKDFFDQGPAFARSIGYDVVDRSDQPTVDTLAEALTFATENAR